MPLILEHHLKPVQEGPLVRLYHGILEERESVAQFLGVIAKSGAIATDTKEQGRGDTVAGQYFRGAFLSQELIHPVVVVGVDGSQLGSRVGAVIERDKQAPGVTRSAEFIVDVALDGSPLLVRRYAVIETTIT